MSMTDPIADFLTRIRNAIRPRTRRSRSRPRSSRPRCARILREQGYIDGFEVEAPDAEHPGEILRVQLKYTDDRRSAISGLRRVSRPGQRLYVDRTARSRRSWAAWAPRSSRPRPAS